MIENYMVTEKYFFINNVVFNDIKKRECWGCNSSGTGFYHHEESDRYFCGECEPVIAHCEYCGEELHDIDNYKKIGNDYFCCYCMEELKNEKIS